jgi:hypothetical protein
MSEHFEPIYSLIISGCGHRRFGQNCTSVCHCFSNASCNKISGECHNGICDRGWQTPSCDEGKIESSQIFLHLQYLARNINACSVVTPLHFSFSFFIVITYVNDYNNWLYEIFRHSIPFSNLLIKLKGISTFWLYA